jgi:hypothetical protein
MFAGQAPQAGYYSFFGAGLFRFSPTVFFRLAPMLRNSRLERFPAPALPTDK